MKILIVGNGGREHAIGWSLQKDSRVSELYFAPGNAGTARIGTNLDMAATDLDSIAAWAEAEQPDLTVVGPEAPLCLGLVDRLYELGLKAFGPDKQAAQLEGSKVFTKNLMNLAKIPTAESAAFTDAKPALEYVVTAELPLVVKADGLAAGKGVLICQTREEAAQAIHLIMQDRQFGDAGHQVLIEEFLDGQEASIHAVTDGTDLVFFSPSQDHKRIFDGDQGPNTGGMGAYAPAPAVDAELLESVTESVFKPLLAAFREKGIRYQGVLYGGLMLTAQGPKVLEFNARFGDPETQVLLPLLETPLLDILLATVNGALSSIDFKVKPQSAMTVVMASPGYPDQPRTGDIISGLDKVESEDQFLFHAGTSGSPDAPVTAGGRVLAVTGIGPTLHDARGQAYAGIGKISFPDAQYRKDIGHRAL
ncbi:MAG: phosphoribosylamine--glycine ligase [Verrucomicrobiota bacterium]